jgi:hypothetical protein
MSCCGNQRSALRQEWGTAEQRESEYFTFDSLEFEYSGNGELTVTGPLSGLVYNFSAGNRRVRVHGSDAPSLLAVPGLRPLR